MFSDKLENELSKIGSLALNYDIFKNVCIFVINKPFKKEIYKGKSGGIHG